MMKRPITTYSPFDVVVVPFPFTDTNQSKRRPALVLSSKVAFNSKTNHSVMAMITSATHTPWALDTPIGDLKAAGLQAPSVIRMKLFTLDHRLVIKKIGALSAKERATVRRTLTALLPPS